MLSKSGGERERGRDFLSLSNPSPSDSEGGDWVREGVGGGAVLTDDGVLCSPMYCCSCEYCLSYVGQFDPSCDCEW